ncbi:hypothetical protein DRQ20_04525 [bacterium]|nr:MAG: hypothetical protein DRQ20_04525 [bacterium]
MKRLLPFLLAFLLIAGCGGGEELTDEEAQDAAQTAVTGISVMAPCFFFPDAYTPEGVKGDTMWTEGDLTDNDMDGVTVSGRFHYMIDTVTIDTLFLNDTIKTRIEGTVIHDDEGTDDDPFTWHVQIKNDNDPEGYFIMNWLGINMKYKGEVSATKEGNTYSVSVDEWFYMESDSGNAGMHWDITIAFTPDNEDWTPGSIQDVTGTMTFSGEYGFFNEKEFDFTVETTRALEVSYALGEFVINSGELLITDAHGNEIKVVFTGNNQYTIYLNGREIS